VCIMATVSKEPSATPDFSVDHQDERFTAELTQFLTSLVKTSESELATSESLLSDKLIRLRDAVLQEVDAKSETNKSMRDSDESRDTSSSVDPNSSTDQSMSTASENSPQRDNSGSVDRSSSGSSSGSNEYESISSTDDSSILSNISFDSASNRAAGTGSTIPCADMGVRAPKRINFSLQSGVKYELTEYDIGRAFAQFGPVQRVSIKGGAGRGDCWDGHVVFHHTTAAERATSRVVRVNDCQLYSFPPWSHLTDNPVPNMILLESRYLPNIWERELVMRSFFTKFGVVDGVMFLGFKRDDMKGFVVAFKYPEPAQRLIGQSVKILSSTVFITEVTRRSIQTWGTNNYNH